MGHRPEDVARTWFHEFVYTMMRHDLYEAIESKSNFLGALGVVCYGETLGALKRGTIGKKRETSANFEAFLDALPPAYKQVDGQLKAQWGNDNGIYDKVRCGLVHEYAIKIPHTVYRHASPTAPCGIVQNPDPKDPRLLVILKQLVDDFFVAAQAIETEIIMHPPSDTLAFFERFIQ